MTLEPRAYAQQHNTPIISPATEKFLTQLLHQLQPQNVVEVGSAIGCSTMLIAQTIQSRGGQLTSFEISHPSYQIAMWNLWKSRTHNCKLYRHDFTQAPLERLLEPQIDFVFIDGMKAQYYQYVVSIIPYCQPGASIICDDVIAFADKIATLYSYLEQKQMKYTTTQLEQSDGILHIQL